MPTSIEIASAKQGAHVPYILGHTDREGGFMITGQLVEIFTKN